jgi:hypothetical protein
MAHDGFSTGVAPDSLLELTVAAGQTLVLSEVFRPGGHGKRFEIDIGVLEVTEDVPA